MSTHVLKIKEQNWKKVLKVLVFLNSFINILENFKEQVSNILKIRKVCIQKTSNFDNTQYLRFTSVSFKYMQILFPFTSYIHGEVAMRNSNCTIQCKLFI